MKNKISALFACLFFCNFYPFFITNWFFKASFILGAVFSVLWFLTLLPSMGKQIKMPNTKFSVCCLVTICYFFIRYVFYNESYAITYIINIVFGWLGVLLMLNSLKLEKVANFLYRFIFIMILSSLIGLTLYSLGIVDIFMSQEYGDISSYGSRHINNYIFFNAKVGEFSDLIFLRTAGWFDEPGSFAYVICLLLVLNLYYNYSRSKEYKLLLGGLVTLSAAHIIISTVYLTLRNFTYKKIFYLLLAGGIVVVLYYMIPKDGVGGFIRHATFERFENIQEGSDRSRDFDTSQKAMKDFWLFGASDEYIMQKYPEATRETIYFHIAQFGLFGIPFYYLILIVGFFNRKMCYKSFLTGVILLLLFGQRPEYLFPFYILVFYYIFYDKSISPVCMQSTIKRNKKYLLRG